MTAPATVTAPAASGLVHLPLALFAAPMGVGGLGLAWREASRALGAPQIVGELILAAAAVVWVTLAVLHVRRAMRHPEALAGDLKHPIRAAFAGAVGIGLMIVAGALAPYAADLSRLVWLAAILVQNLAALWVVRVLIKAPRDAATLTPPLLIPLVGNFVAPLAGVALGFEELSWILFGIGAVLWLLLQPLLVGRLASGPELPPKLKPSLAILLAPPAVGSLALWQLTGSFGPGPLALLGFAMMVFLVLASLWREIFAAPFSMAWWSLTFPLAAFTTAMMVYFRHHPAAWSGAVEWPLLVGATVIVGFVAWGIHHLLFGVGRVSTDNGIGRYIFGDGAVGGDDCAVTDLHPGHDDTVVTDPHIVADDGIPF